tara:strand:+ start:140 stop:748 length:609 start_codon:yes stop_codon:yes gene_type:complete
MDHNNILGVVLAGGKSLRFGQDKSQVKLGDKILIDYILNEIIDQFNEILVIANKQITFMNSKKISIINDYQKDLGPLGGVLTAMKWIQNNKKTYNWISTFPTDTPFFTKKELIKFYKNINYTESKLFFMKSRNTRHNIFGLWSIDLINSLEKDLLNNEKKVETWANKKGVRTIEIDFNDKDPFFNINTVEDYEKAKEMIKND